MDVLATGSGDANTYAFEVYWVHDTMGTFTDPVGSFNVLILDL